MIQFRAKNSLDLTRIVLTIRYVLKYYFVHTVDNMIPQNQRHGAQGIIFVPLQNAKSMIGAKIKYYLEASGNNIQAVSALLPIVVTELGEVWMEAEKYNLGRG